MNFIPSHIEPRATYIERVQPFIGKNLIKVFTGQRRVGKSYLLFQIMEQVKKDYSDCTIVYVNKEDLLFSALQTAQDLHDYVVAHEGKTGKTFVFIDEIQDIIDFQTALRSLVLHENLDLYCTGSNANLLSGDIAGHLSGRFVEITVYSLSYIEFLQFHALVDSETSLNLYLKYGGLPYLKHLPLEDSIIFEYLKNIYSTIVYKDIINRYAVRNVVFLEQLVHFLAAHTGSVFSAKKISDFLKSQQINIAPNQVQVYVQHLVNAFLIHKVSRYDLIGKRLFEIGDKYYFENLGIRNGIWGFRLEDLGKIIENVVYNHLVYRGYDVKVGTLGDKEVDFIGQKNSEKIYVQVALSLQDEKTIAREFGNLIQIADNYPKMVVSLTAFEGASYLGITTISLRNFLLTI
jgi:predicted AAA+ superfamily ATPase